MSNNCTDFTGIHVQNFFWLPLCSFHESLGSLVSAYQSELAQSVKKFAQAPLLGKVSV